MATTRNSAATTSRHRHRRWPRRVLITLVVLLALVGVWSIKQAFAGPPGVGHFDDADGQRAYLDAYRKAFAVLPEPTAVHDVPTNWGTVRAYEWAGPPDAPDTPVLLAPGRSSGVPMWSGNLPHYLASHRVIAVDALGDAGLSVQGTPLMSFDEQADWIDQVVTQLAPQGVHLVGHSFGAATAATYARIHPERVRTLVLLEPVFTLGWPPAWVFTQATIATLPFLPESVRNRALGRIGGAEFDDSDPMVAMIGEGTQHYRAALPTPSPLDETQRARLTMPVYVALAETHSAVAPVGKGEVAARRLPNATVKVWRGTTHSLPMQVAEQLDAELAAFWAQHEH